MSQTTYEGKTKVYFCPSIADTEAPTLAEIAAGTNFSPAVVKDGISFPSGQNMVDSATINEVFDSQRVGSWGGAPLGLTMQRDDEDETDTYDFIQYGLEGFIVILPFTPAAPQAGDKCSVWPVEAHEPTLQNPAANTMQRFNATFAVTSEPAMRAVVAA